MEKSTNRIMNICLAAFVLSVGCFEIAAQSTNKPSSHAHKADEHRAPKSGLEYEAKAGFQKISFEELGAFQIKVDWVMNLTNSAADSLKREGEIPARVKALDGKRVSIAGFMKPVRKDDSGGSTEFLLLQQFSTCCEGQLPRINELIHVRTTGKAIPLVGEKMVAVRGVLQVGEKLGVGNIVSIYRLEAAELEIVDSRRDGR